MNKQIMRFLILIMSFLMTLLHADSHVDQRDTYGKPFFAARSQGDNLARRLAGEVHELYPCLCCTNGVLSVAAEYTETFHNKAIGRYFSFRRPIDKCDCFSLDNVRPQDSNIMRFRGSLANNPPVAPANTDVLAENFLLPSTFSGLVELKPKAHNAILDFNWRMNLETVQDGLYFEIGVPVVWTRWHMQLEEITGTQPGNIQIPGVPPFTAPAPYDTIIAAWRDTFNGVLDFTNGLEIIPVTVDPMEFARVDGSRKKHGIADIKFILGRNYICDDCGHFGLELRIIAPTGNRPKGQFVFEPIIGNGHHVGVGAGMSGHVSLWNDQCCDTSMSIWAQGNVYSLLKTRQIRTFDIAINGIGSRYLLLKQFNGAGNFADIFVPGPDVTTLPAHVKIKVMGEFVLLFDWQWRNVTLDLGYNLWGRSRERITITGQIPANTYGILGGTGIAGDFANRTNSLAEINGNMYSVDGDGQNPVFLTTNDLDARAAEAPSALTNKFFAHLGYTFEGCRFDFFMGVGGEVEFSGIRNNAFDQWGIWGKVGFAYS